MSAAPDVALAEVRSPSGGYVVGTDDDGVVRLVAWAEDFVCPPGARWDPDVAGPAAAALGSFLHGESRTVGVTYSLEGVSGFRRDVLAAVAEIPWGETWTYGEVAAEVGSPRAARAVGSACRANPVPVVVPCHRVVAAGGLGGFGRGYGCLDRKRALLRLEGHTRPDWGI